MSTITLDNLCFSPASKDQRFCSQLRRSSLGNLRPNTWGVSIAMGGTPKWMVYKWTMPLSWIHEIQLWILRAFGMKSRNFANRNWLRHASPFFRPLTLQWTCKINLYTGKQPRISVAVCSLVGWLVCLLEGMRSDDLTMFFGQVPGGSSVNWPCVATKKHNGFMIKQTISNHIKPYETTWGGDRKQITTWGGVKTL